MISLNEADHELYESRVKHWRDDQACLAEQREEGLSEGLSKGLSKGVILGHIQMLESLLGLASSPIDLADSQSLEELLRIETDLKAKLATRP